MNLIECINLAQYYGKKKIYENLSFCVDVGNVVALLGKNGANKSTMINILMENSTPSSGKCLIYGENSSNLSSKIRAKIGLYMRGIHI